MTNLKGKNLDDFFKKGLSNGDIPFDEEHWLRLEKRLKKNKPKHTIAWITLSGIAAMLLLTLSVSDIFFKDIKSKQTAGLLKKPSENTVLKSLPGTGEDRSTDNQAIEVTGETLENKLTANNSSTMFHRKINRVNKTSSALLTERAFNGLLAQATSDSRTESTIVSPEETLPAAMQKSDQAEQKNVQTETLAQTNSVPEPKKADSVFALTTESVSPGTRFSVSLLAGPDINGVNSLKSNRGGLSFGLLLNYRISKSFSVSTGALYAKKLYNTEFEYYKPNTDYKFPTSPKTVNADCRVLDIPLNINFTALSKAKDAVSLSAGMSSYLMLSEGYSFTYETAATRGPKTYYITNRNKHYMGILNVGAAYERKITNEVSIGVQPYMKLPVTDIGYGNVKLLSTGVLTSVKLNISKNK